MTGCTIGTALSTAQTVRAYLLAGTGAAITFGVRGTISLGFFVL
jgi:hypothetical protein